MAHSQPARELVLIKLGGSLITDKRRPETPRLDVLARLGREIASARPRPLVVGHGSGSFGHVAAAEAGLAGGRFARADAVSAADPDRTRERARGLARTQDAAARLHRMVVSSLLEAGLAPWSWPPSTGMMSATEREGDERAGLETVGSEVLHRALAAGLLPVVHGDVVLERAAPTGRIASTEEVLDRLVDRLAATGWRVRRMLWLGETDGIWDAAGKTVPIVDDGTVAAVRQAIAPAAGTDVTGGMLHRLETARALAARGIESLIANGLREGLLTRALDDESAGGEPVTRVLSSGTAPQSSPGRRHEQRPGHRHR